MTITTWRLLMICNTIAWHKFSYSAEPSIVVWVVTRTWSGMFRRVNLERCTGQTYLTSDFCVTHQKKNFPRFRNDSDVFDLYLSYAQFSYLFYYWEVVWCRRQNDDPLVEAPSGILIHIIVTSIIIIGCTDSWFVHVDYDVKNYFVVVVVVGRWWWDEEQQKINTTVVVVVRNFIRHE